MSHCFAHIHRANHLYTFKLIDVLFQMWIPNLASILSVRSYQGKITLKNLLYNKPTILLALAQISFMCSDQRIYLITYRNMNC